MKSRVLALVIIGLLTAAPVFCQKETRTVSSFHKISFGIPGELHLKLGSVQSVQLDGDKEDLDKIVTEVVNGQLRIKMRDDRLFNWNFSNNVIVNITVPELDDISLGGSGKIIGEGAIKSDNLNLSVSGSGRMELTANSDNLKLDVSGSGKMDLTIDAGSVDEGISGSGNISLQGNAKDVNLDISGSGKLDAPDLNAKTYIISISGSGRSTIAASESITSNISGSGSVIYKGEPDKIISKVSGSGKVKKMD